MNQELRDFLNGMARLETMKFVNFFHEGAVRTGLARYPAGVVDLAPADLFGRIGFGTGQDRRDIEALRSNINPANLRLVPWILSILRPL